MENATKALMIAAGVLLTILALSLLVYSWLNISSYYDSQDSLKEVENISKFNNQFSGYDRKGVSGFDVISLANKIRDYNLRYSNSEGAKNNYGYTSIALVIDLISEDDRKKFTYDNNIRLFTNVNNCYTQTDFNQITQIINEESELETALGGTNIASKVAKSFPAIIPALAVSTNYPGKNELRELTTGERKALEELCKENFNHITGKKYESYSQIENEFFGNNNYDKIYKYYEYYQFKKAKFDCESVEYNSESGRISNLYFKFTGNF